MRIQTPDRVKEAPTHALRAMFSGVGQVLTLPGRVWRRGGHEDMAPAAADTATATVPAPRPAEAETPATEATVTETVAPAEASTTVAKKPAAKKPAAKTSPAETGTAKASAAKKPAARKPAAKAPSTKAAAGQASPAGTPAAAEVETSPVKEEKTQATAATADLPIPNYPDLTIASLRARMRGLDVAQLTTLLDYERAHDGRENVITMFERRLAKVTDES
jgi:hypothetical protein